MPAFADRIKETSTTTGTGSVTLAGAATGFKAFSSGFNSGQQVYYVIEMGAEWEVGLGTFTAPSTLARDKILSSSNSDAAVNFSAGTKDVYGSFPALMAALSGIGGSILLADFYGAP